MHLPTGQSQHIAFCAARQPWHKDPKGSQVKSTTCTCQRDVGQGILSTVSWRNTIPIHREKILKTEKESKSNSFPMTLTEVGKTRMNDINEIYANESVDRWQKWNTYLSWLSFIAASNFLLPTQPLGQMTSDNSRILIFGLVAIVVKSPVLCVLFRNHWYSIQVKPSCNVGFTWKDSQICSRYSSWKLLI